MPAEPNGYREALEDILKFTGNRRLLNYKEALAYTGLKDYRALHKRVPSRDGYISATTLALYMAGGNPRS